MPLPLATKFFHFDHWSDQKRGWAPLPLEIENWLESPPLEPSPGTIPAYDLEFSDRL